MEEGAPYFVKVLKQHCEEKRCQSAAKMQRDTDRKKVSRKSKIGGISKPSELDISTSNPRESKCFDEVFKLQSKLNEAFPVKLLYTNRSKYGL